MKDRGSRRDGRSMLLRLLAGMVAVGSRPYSQLKSAKGPAVRGYVRTLNFGI